MVKKTIMLVCAAGMSTSLLVTKMQKAAESLDFDTEIFAVSASEADQRLADQTIDVLMLGPQVRYLEGDFKKKVASQKIPVATINMQDYGMMNGKKVLEHALKLMEEGVKN